MPLTGFRRRGKLYGTRAKLLNIPNNGSEDFPAPFSIAQPKGSFLASPHLALIFLISVVISAVFVASQIDKFLTKGGTPPILDMR